MHFEIIYLDSGLTREVWDFALVGDFIYFQSYRYQTKETTRHKKWITGSYWAVSSQRDTNIPKPNIPKEVEIMLRKQIADRVSDFRIL